MTVFFKCYPKDDLITLFFVFLDISTIHALYYQMDLSSNFGIPVFLCLQKVLFGLMFIYNVAFIEVWGSYWDQRHSSSHRFAWCVGHCRRPLIKTLTRREEWTYTENRGVTIGWWKMECVCVCVCVVAKERHTPQLYF